MLELPSQPHSSEKGVAETISSSSSWSYDKLQETPSQTCTYSILFYLLGSLAALLLRVPSVSPERAPERAPERRNWVGLVCM